MAEADSRELRRLRKPGWKDPRLVVGVLLVVASVAGVVALVAGLDRTEPAYVAREDIPLGAAVTPDRLDAVDVRLDGVGADYLTPGDGVGEGLKANTLIKAGELVPLRALAPIDAPSRKPVSLELRQALPQSVAVGGRVDVWAAAREEGGTGYGEPRLLLPAAEVSALRPIDSGFAGTAGTVLEVLVEDAALPGLLGALANESRLTVVHNPSGAAP